MEQKVVDAINNQINEELSSYYLYSSMACHLRYIGYRGISKWLFKQACEEIIHANKFINYLHHRDAEVVLNQINAPKHTWENPSDIFEDGLKHEKHITEKIGDLTDLALSERDHMTCHILQWFIGEQIEEEYKFVNILDKLSFLDDSHKIGMAEIDRELGELADKP